MAEKRKLLAEIEKCFKKIDEGVELFEETMGKMSESNSDNQREKLQDDLKKEIKKLQRLRDQVKNWQSSSEIKDKEKLTAYRKLIESKMEQFKDVERDHKTKPHSKQGLCAEEKLDPRERARAECVEWLNNTLRAFNDENDKCEASLELLSSGDNGRRRGKGKDDPKKVEKEKELRTLMEGVKFHMDKLELVMRLVDNETLDPKVIEDTLKEELDQLFCELETDGTLYDCESAYDELDLESYAATFGKNPSVDDERHDDYHPNNGHTSPDHSSRHPSTDVPPSPALVKRTTSMSSNHHAPLKISDSSPSVDGIGSIPPPLVSPSAPPTPPPPPVIPYNSIAARSTNSTPASVGSKSVVTPSPSIASPSVVVPPPPVSPSVASLASLSSLASPTSSLPPPSSLSTPPPIAVSSAPSLPSSIVSSAAVVVNDENGVIPSTEQPVHTQVATLPQVEEEEMVGVEEGEEQEEEVESTVIDRSPSPPSAPSTTHSDVPLTQEMTKNVLDDVRSMNDVNSMSEDLRTVLRMSQSEPKSVDPQTANIPAYLGASPLGRHPPMDDHDKHLGALEVAVSRLPQQMDSERPRSYLPKMPCSTPSFYPQAAPSNADSMEYYLRLSPETLFFTFYYMEGSRAQLIAAKALKKLSWRFHTKYLMWFQRHEEPKQITDDFEEGTYIYFDYEKWSQRKKEQFRFEYRYLEDRELD
ncbi:hypothetical protein PFISCL1PPCAC_10324 [Pristionchus fissidentatus]|uniref:Uncharacterized protein n=1 Tax=Pristionchus fissidentatus TaxID=1538716 RepID=A0AAV5VH34_9BILA|nr:hypothetical protein PFISCL1PPCAC_10324 [Pristionchus fissidentatus]